MSERVLDELGYYLLAGAGGEGPATLMDEARRGEELGFGTAFISERWNVKEASSLVGAACAVTERMQIATAATNHNTRHPLITGSWATTMHRLSRGRFTLGIGRGIAAMYNAFGVPAVTTAQMEDFAQVMRRLWHGEVIFNHDGRSGNIRSCSSTQTSTRTSGWQSSPSDRRPWLWVAESSTMSSCTPTSRRTPCNAR